MNALKTIYHDILLVWTFFTRIPAPHFMTQRKLSQALWALWLPAFALAVCQLVMVWIFGWFLSLGSLANFFGFSLLILSLVFTGALHWDGLADLFDGLGVEKDRRQSVMRDSSVGAFGVLGLISAFMLIGILLSLFILLSATWLRLFLGLFIIALFSRHFMALAWACLPPADSQSQTQRYGTPRLWVHVILLVLCFLLGFGFGLFAWWTLYVFGVLGGLWLFFLNGTQGGVSGDSLGATQVLGEALVLLMMLISL